MNSMIYICYIIYRDYVITCVLAVGDDELAVGDNDDASSGVAAGRHVQEEFSEFRMRILMSSERSFKSVFQNLSYVNAFHSPRKDQNDENK